MYKKLTSQLELFCQLFCFCLTRYENTFTTLHKIVCVLKLYLATIDTTCELLFRDWFLFPRNWFIFVFIWQKLFYYYKFLEKNPKKFGQKILQWFFVSIISQHNITYYYASFEAKMTFHWIVQLVLRSTLEKLEILKFQWKYICIFLTDFFGKWWQE